MFVLRASVLRASVLRASVLIESSMASMASSWKRPWQSLLVAALTCVPATSSGSVIYTGTSVVFSGSGAGGLSARATFTVDPVNPDLLRLLLENTSPSPTLSPSELLTSFYFNVLTGTTTGTAAPLTYDSASGQVYLTVETAADKPATYVPPPPPGGTVTFPPVPVPSDLQAFSKGDNTWQFRSGLSLVQSGPSLSFGVGTVGNNSLSPNGFNGNIVDGFDFGIYVGDVSTKNLRDTLLVKSFAAFAFAGFKNHALARVTPHAVFGFGSTPELIIPVREPATLPLTAFGLLAAFVARRSSRKKESALPDQGT